MDKDTNVKVTTNSQSREWTRHQYKGNNKKSNPEQRMDKTTI